MNKGFSLVELIVVIAIMAILVGVAVPVYTSYIGKANEATDIQAIDNLEHACEIVGIEYNVKISFELEGNVITAIVEDDDTTNQAAAVAQLKTILGDSVVVTENEIALTLDTTPIKYAATNPDKKPMVPNGINGGTTAE